MRWRESAASQSPLISVPYRLYTFKGVSGRTEKSNFMLCVAKFLFVRELATYLRLVQRVREGGETGTR